MAPCTSKWKLPGYWRGYRNKVEADLTAEVIRDLKRRLFEFFVNFSQQ